MINKFIFILYCLMTTSFAYAQSLKIKLETPIIQNSSDVLVGNVAATNNGLKKEVVLALNNLKGARNSSSFCSNSDNSSVFASRSVSCSEGTTPDRIKVTIPFSLSYDIDEGVQVDIVGFQQNNGSFDPLLNISMGSTILTNSGALVTDLSHIYSSSGNKKSQGYGGTDLNRNANITFEVPYKGSTFKSERSSIIKVFAIIQSI